MARNQPPFTWARDFKEHVATDSPPVWADEKYYVDDEEGPRAHYVPTDQDLRRTTKMGTAMGVDELPGWPAFNGIHNANELPNDLTHQERKYPEEVDVLICEAGPFGLEVAICLARMGLTFRIVDKAETLTLTGRADGLQPRAVEHLHAWGLSSEFTEEGPLLSSTVLFRNGVKLVHDAMPCDSRYRGSHIITQGQIEKIYIRNLRRHDVLVERGVVAEGIHVQKTTEQDMAARPVSVTLRDIQTGTTENVRAKYLVGADGAASATREMMGIPFDGLTTDCYRAIMDCQFKTDFPYILGFCIIISEEHGGIIIIPHEDGYTRFYTQITGDKARQLSKKRNGRRNSSDVGATRIDDHGITADEVLEQLNKIMAPWKVEFASAMSWFAVWRVNERVARAFSTPDQRIHIGGDAVHVHSVLGAFGLNSSIYDAANLSWKLGLSIQGAARPGILLPTYDSERRLFAIRVIRISGVYLRFICNMNQPLAQLRGLGEELEVHQEDLPVLDGTTEADKRFLHSFFGRNQHFLLGVEDPIVESAICPPDSPSSTNKGITLLTSLRNEVRVPNPRVCFGLASSGYLYDAMLGVARFHILVFVSDMQTVVRAHLIRFAKNAFASVGFYGRFGGSQRFNILLVTKALP
ncbi:FAD binding domain-containing protein [Pyrenophora tritici-repentis]|nr:FAD binding domain-containing protein [Pyrenophora tritici-repentis]KAI1688717.1 FAD binding domain-containing protein [Pyrenophora tritici-repentis]